MRFAPDAARARELDSRMHHELGSSLAYLSEACKPMLGELCEALHSQALRLQGGTRFPPLLFADYYEFAQCLLADRFGDAGKSAIRIVESHPAASGLTYTTLADDAFGRKCIDLLRDDPHDPAVVTTPDRAQAMDYLHKAEQALALLDELIPELGGEIRGLVRQIVMVGRNPGSAVEIEGGSHYQMWGALFLAVDPSATVLDVAETLAHESAHSLLFGLCTDEALVTNAGDQLSISPLRSDARPIDGIYHATFVSARMLWTMDQLSRSERLTVGQREAARIAARRDLASFLNGRSVLRKEAEFTPLGARIMAGADEFVDSLALIET